MALTREYDLRNPLARARDAWILSQEGQRCADPLTIGAALRQAHYLRNRLEAAFVAGWNAREEQTKE